VLVVLLLLAPLAAAGPSGAGAAPASTGGTPAPAQAGDYIVVYEPDTAEPLAETRRLERRHGVRSRQRFARAVKGFAARLTPGQVEDVAADPDVAYVAPDRPRGIVGSVALRAGETAPTGTRRSEAATTSATREAATSGVAVIDTGVDLDHPDLTVADGRDCTGTGSADDDNGHGTHVAGSIGAANTGAGVVGIAPGTTIHPVKVLDAQGSGSDSSVICGLDWVAANAASLDIRVANLSLGGPGSDDGACGSRGFDPLHAAICRVTARGVSVVVAAGNEAVDLGGSAPATYSEVLTVTAMADSDGAPGGDGGTSPCGERDDAFASFSNYATDVADADHTIAAPGACITSTYPDGGYARMSGSSMAAPHVAGVIASCLGEAGEAGPCADLTPAEIVVKLRADAGARTAQDPAYGFLGDPARPAPGRSYGPLVWQGSATTATSSPAPADPSPSEPTPESSAPAPAPATRVAPEPAPTEAPAPGAVPAVPQPPTPEVAQPRAFFAHLAPRTARVGQGTAVPGRAGVARLYRDDAIRLEVAGRRSAGAVRSELTATTTVPPAQRALLKGLTISVDVNASAARATVGLRVYNVARRRFETVVAPRGGLTRDRRLTWSPRDARSYVSRSGVIRLSVRSAHGAAVRTRVDHVRFRVRV